MFSISPKPPIAQAATEPEARHFFAHGPDGLGPVKWGVQRYTQTTPWAVSARSVHPEKKWQTAPTAPSVSRWGSAATEQSSSVQPLMRADVQVQRLQAHMVTTVVAQVASRLGLDERELAGALRELNPQDDFRHALAGLSGAVPQRLDSRRAHAAYAVLMELATTAPGLDALKSHVPALRTLNEQDAERLIILMNAARHVQPSPGRGFVPHRLLRRALACDSIAQRAVVGLAFHLGGRSRWAVGFDWAINAVRNGLFDDGPGSRFDQIDARLQKMGKWLDRAERKRGWRVLLPWLKKSPFRAMRFGVMGADRTDVKLHETSHYKNLQAASDALLKHVQSVRRSWHAVPPRDRSAWRARVAATVLEIVLAQFSKHVQEAQAGGGACAFRVQAADMAAIKALVAKSVPPRRVQQALAHPLFRQLQRGVVDMRFLKRQARRVSVWGPWQASGRARFDAAMAGALEDVQGSSKAVRKVSSAVVERTMHHVIDRIQGASRLKWHSGGGLGVGTKGITTALSGLAGMLLLRGRIDARHSRTRAAVMELAMPPYNMELTLGTQTLRASQLGAGVSVGPQTALSSLTLGADLMAIGCERSQVEGVVLRMPRVRGKEEALREQFKSLVSDLIHHAQGPKRRGQLLRQLLGTYPDLTVNQIGAMTETRRRHGASAEVTGAVDVKMMRALATAQVGVEYQPRVARRYQDVGGALHVRREVNGQMLRGFAGAGVGVRPVLSQGAAQFGLGTADLLGAQADFASAGRILRRDVVATHGRYSTVSFYELEHHTMEDFVASVMANLPAWVRSKAQRAGQSEAKTRAEILDFLDQAKRHARVQHTFAQRYELRDDYARWVGALSAHAKVLERSNHGGNAIKAQLYRDRARQLLDDPTAYEPASFRIYERADKAARTGLNVVGQWYAHDYAEGVFAHSRLM